MTHALELEENASVVSNTEGSISMGWIGERVLFARFEGTMSPEIGRAHATRFALVTKDSAQVAYFADGSALLGYDLLVRSAFVRFVLARPGLFRSIDLLVPDSAVRRIVEPLSTTLAGLVRIESQKEAFERRLLAAAPFALRMPVFQRNGSSAQAESGRRMLRSSLRPKHPRATAPALTGQTSRRRS